MKATIKQVYEAWNALDAGAIDIEDSKPTCMSNAGQYMILLDQDIGKEFDCNGCTCIAANYWSDVKGSKAEARYDLIQDLEAGLCPMSPSTAFECGIEL